MPHPDDPRQKDWRYQAAFLAGARPLTLATNLLRRRDQIPTINRPARLAAVLASSLIAAPPSL